MVEFPWNHGSVGCHRHNHGVDNLPVAVIGSRIPVVRVSRFVLEALESEILGFEEAKRGLQLK